MQAAWGDRSSIGGKISSEAPGRPSPPQETPATTSTTTARPDKVLFRTRRGLHLQYDPEPSIDQWINSEVQFDWEKGKYMKTTGEVLSATEESTFGHYRSRHIIRCRAGDLADKLTRITDKYLPRVANESRVYIMRFPETVPKLLKRARKIRRRIKATKQGDTKVAVQPPRRGKRQESIPDWGDDVVDDVVDTAEENLAMATAAHMAEGDDATSMWPWGNRGRPSDRGESVGGPRPTTQLA